MLQRDARSAAHAEVLRRIFDLTGHGLSRPLGHGILSLDFTDTDALRIAELSEKANEGQSSEGDNAELEAYRASVICWPCGSQKPGKRSNSLH